MAERTGIQWCDSTSNPWIGCTKVSPGCDNCYAAQQDSFRKWTPAGWGPGQPRKRTSEANWRQPMKWNDTPFFECPDCGARGDALAMGDEPKGCNHLNAKPARRRVFCASLADVFDNEVPDQWRADLTSLMEATPNLDWLVLTKRIGNVPRMVDAWMAPGAWPAHVWLGATVVNQEEADRDIPKLLTTPARVRFLSMEPLLELVTVAPYLQEENWRADGSVGYRGMVPGTKVDWVIAGGESGPGARPMHPDWARSLRDQCAAAGVPFLFKQWGEHAPTQRSMAEVAASGRKLVAVQKYPGQRFPLGLVDRVGKKAAGRLLDGVEHNGFPEEKHA